MIRRAYITSKAAFSRSSCLALKKVVILTLLQYASSVIASSTWLTERSHIGLEAAEGGGPRPDY